MDAERVGGIMAEIGPRDPEIVAVVALGSGGWIVRYETADIEAEFDEASQRLTLSTDVASVPPETRAAVLSAMLSYNLLWRETGGVRMALTPDDTAVQIADLADDFASETLLLALGNLRDKAAVWRKVIETGASEDTKVDSLSPLGIRV